MRLETHKMLALSTAHVSRETMETIEADGADCCTWLNEHGAILSCLIFNEGDPEFAANMPEDLYRVICFARDQGCRYVMLDCDADRVEELPTFNW